MGELTYIEKVKGWISSAGWAVFLWGLEKTDQQYWDDIYWQEKFYRESNNLPL